MNIHKLIATSAIVATLSACTTTGNFVLPENTDLYLNNRDKPEEVAANGSVTTRPFGWSAMGVAPNGGVPYKLVQDGETVKEGNLRVIFRAESLFWPPLADLYWPTGLNPNITYDLVKDTQK